MRVLIALIKIHQILIFETAHQFFFDFCINLQCHEAQVLCTFLDEILYPFNKRNLSRYKFGKIESLRFGILMGSFHKNSIKFQLKKYRIITCTRLKSDPKFKEKLTFSFKYDMRNLVKVYATTQKSKNFTSMSSFCLTYLRFELKKIQRSYFS